MSAQRIPHAAQEAFDSKYISATEIAEELGVSRTSVFHARMRNQLPNAIVVSNGHICIWERDYIKPYLAAWRAAIAARKASGKGAA